MTGHGGCANLSRLSRVAGAGRYDTLLQNPEGIMSGKFNRRHFIAAGTATVAMPFLLRGASAQTPWPSRQIRMICSYPAGGQTDLQFPPPPPYITHGVIKV